MRALLSMAVLLALFAATAAYGTRTAPRIWLAAPTIVDGSGFPAGKVTVTARMPGQKAVRVVRASRAGRFVARFDTAVKANGCQQTTVTALAASGIQATLRVPGNAKECPSPIDPGQ